MGREMVGGIFSDGEKQGEREARVEMGLRREREIESLGERGSV